MNRQVRQEAIREQLANQQHLIHIVELLQRIADPNDEVANEMLPRWKVVIESKLKLVNKYLPDLKAIEHSGDNYNPLVTKTVIEFVNAQNKGSSGV